MRTTQFKINNERFMRLLKETVERKQLTKMDIEEQYGIKYTTFRHWEKGFSVPSPANWKVLAKILDLSVKDFFFYISDMDEASKNNVFNSLYKNKSKKRTEVSQHNVSVQHSQIVSSHIDNSRIDQATNSSPKNIVELLNTATKEEVFTLVCYLSPTVRGYFQCALDSTQYQMKNKGLFADFSEFG